MAGEGRQRIDKWLFFARILKSRSLAAKLVQAGRVRINGEKTDQASSVVRRSHSETERAYSSHSASFRRA